MRRLHFGLLGSTLFAAALGVFLAGCSKDDKKDETELKENTRPKGSSTQPKKGGGEWKAVEGKGTATLKGTITVSGSDPSGVLEQLTNNIKAEMGKHENKGTCLAGGPTEITEQVYRLSEDKKRVGNVVVWVMPPDKNSYFKIDPKQVEEAKKSPVVIDQPHCAFLPHVSTMFVGSHDPKKPKEIVPTDQELRILNNAGIGHNTSWKGGPDEPTGNQATPKSGVDVKNLVPDYQEPLTISCTIHGWMKGYVWLFDHPYATVSRSDTAPKGLEAKPADATFGTYEIKGVPAGVKLRVVAWHEKAGFLNGSKGEEIELKEGDNTKDFSVAVTP
jgi:hypothetical protein